MGCVGHGAGLVLVVVVVVVSVHRVFVVSDDGVKVESSLNYHTIREAIFTFVDLLVLDLEDLLIVCLPVKFPGSIEAYS